MNTVRIKSYAKINLTLEITGVHDGYHTLDSLVASVDIFDLLVVKKRKDGLSSVTMHGLGSESIPSENNIALKTAERCSQKFGIGGVDITVYKNIPLGAGLGGSSADAAGVLNAVAKLYSIEDRAGLEAIANEVGSDVRYMMDGGFARMRGRGERVEKVSASATLHALLICPKTSVSSGACYRRYDETATDFLGGGATEKAIESLKKGEVETLGSLLKNDLYSPATTLNADVGRAYEEAKSFSPLGVVMTGSGSAVLAFFETRELCEWAKSRYRGKFATVVVKTVLPEKLNQGWKNPFTL
jgi:4-diphosphocytidyl-2-C-methyl-D-erythritol kinase